MTHEEREGKGEAAEHARMMRRHRAASPTTGTHAMTPAQADWLRKLRDEGPQIIGPKANRRTAGFCSSRCLTDYDRREETGGWYSYAITPAGLAALEAHEKETTR